MSCEKDCFEAILPACSDFIILRAGLTPNTEYYWRIIDRHNNIYQRLVTTDADGDLEIKAADLPPSSMNKYAGNWTLEIRTGADYLVKVPLVFDDVEYNCVQMSFTEINETEAEQEAETNVIK